jgi:glucose/arabinose dehydrogenase
MTGDEQVLINDWCQQYPSHSIGDLAFGSGASPPLYVSGGEGASFDDADYGQFAGNPCGDPGGSGGSESPPRAQGGALRAQSPRRPAGEPRTLDGAILRVDPKTGNGLPGNPYAKSLDPDARRIVAYGLRNPFRFAVRQGTGQLWVGDVGWGGVEEIDRVLDPNSGTAPNFGWPCYEGAFPQPSYRAIGLTSCQGLYAKPSSVTMPYFSYRHTKKVVAGETCPKGSSSTSGLAFYPNAGGPYPPSYHGALFFADYSRNCIWVMETGGGNAPSPSHVTTFDAGAGHPVDLQVGPDGNLYYADLDDGTIRRITYAAGNQTPVAVAKATPTSGNVPLTVSFDASGSSDPDGDKLSYSWDLNGDGAYGDSTAQKPSFTYTHAGSYRVGLEVTDTHGASATDSVAISAGNTPPTPTITAPLSSRTWAVGDRIPFSGSATDAQDGTLPPSALSWSLLLHHCPSNCHIHHIQDFDGVAGGTFTAPDHDYPSYLELRLTATDSGGLTSTQSVRLDPKTVDVTVASSPPGLYLAFGDYAAPAPFTRTVILKSRNTLSASPTQSLGGNTYDFQSWSDGGAATHSITATQNSSYTATYNAR